MALTNSNFRGSVSVKIIIIEVLFRVTDFEDSWEATYLSNAPHSECKKNGLKCLAFFLLLSEMLTFGMALKPKLKLFLMLLLENQTNKRWNWLNFRNSMEN